MKREVDREATSLLHRVIYHTRRTLSSKPVSHLQEPSHPTYVDETNPRCRHMRHTVASKAESVSSQTGRSTTQRGSHKAISLGSLLALDLDSKFTFDTRENQISPAPESKGFRESKSEISLPTDYIQRIGKTLPDLHYPKTPLPGGHTNSPHRPDSKPGVRGK